MEHVNPAWIMAAIGIGTVLINVGFTVAVLKALEDSHRQLVDDFRALIRRVDEHGESIANIRGRMGVNGGRKE